MLNCLFAGNRSASIVIEDGGLYAPAGEWALTLNGVPLPAPETAVVPIYGLEPDTEYTLNAACGDQTETLCFHTLPEAMTLDVRRFGAVGDGLHDDTAALQAAIACCPRDGRVRVPAGRWLTGPLFLKSHIRLELQRGAALCLKYDRAAMPILPGMVEHTDEQGETCFGTWEGNPLGSFASLLTGMDVEDVIIYGQGCLDGQATHETWWANVKRKQGAYRPRMVFFNRCKNMTLHGLTVRNSPAWNLHPFFSENLRFLNLQVEAPANSPNTDGFDPESCADVLLAGTRFSLGDDCIAIKSGKIFLGARDKRPSERILIMHCLMENGHGGVTLGSEMAGGIRQVTVRNCLMRHTDRGLRVKTRRGRGEQGVIDDILFDQVRMEQVRVPLAVNARYFCDPDGRSAYVQSREAQPVDERTPAIGEICFRHVQAEGVACAGWVEGLAERPIRQLTLSQVEMACDPAAEAITPIMAEGVPALRQAGMHICFAEKVHLHEVRITGQNGDAMVCEAVEEMEMV